MTTTSNNPEASLPILSSNDPEASLPIPSSNNPEASLPIRSAPPPKISIHSSNEHVQLWVYQCLRENLVGLTDDEARALAKNVKGRGVVALCRDEEAWEKAVPNWGEVLYTELQLSQKYVMDTIFEFFLVAQTLLLLVAGGSGAFQFVKKEDFQRTKTIGIVFVVYTFFLRVLRTILSSNWVHKSERLPKSLKLRPRGDQSLWKDFAGIPK